MLRWAHPNAMVGRSLHAEERVASCADQCGSSCSRFWSPALHWRRFGIGSPLAAALPEISIDDVVVTEGDGGSVSAVFTVTSSVRGKASVVYATGEGSAQTPADFVARKGTVRFAGKKLTRKIRSR